MSLNCFICWTYWTCLVSIWPLIQDLGLMSFSKEWMSAYLIFFFIILLNCRLCKGRWNLFLRSTGFLLYHLKLLLFQLLLIWDQRCWFVFQRFNLLSNLISFLLLYWTLVFLKLWWILFLNYLSNLVLCLLWLIKLWCNFFWKGLILLLTLLILFVCLLLL